MSDSPDYEEEPKEECIPRPEAAGGERAGSGPLHERVQVPLQVLVQRKSPGRGEHGSQ